MKPLIVISNDDGYFAPGIKHLISVLRPLADLVVVAPNSGRSGFAGAITASQPITLRHHHSEEGLDIFVCTGTPVDCVKMAFDRILPQMGRRADLVCTGINHGDNASINTHYSGTMGAANEGAFQGVPAIGFSLCDHDFEADFTPTSGVIERIVKRVLEVGLPPLSTLNVNFPAGRSEYEGLRLCRMAVSRWENEWAETFRPGRDTPYFWLSGESRNLEPLAEDTDRWALDHGFVSIVPQQLDATNYALLKDFEL